MCTCQTDRRADVGPMSEHYLGRQLENKYKSDMERFDRGIKHITDTIVGMLCIYCQAM